MDILTVDVWRNMQQKDPSTDSSSGNDESIMRLIISFILNCVEISVLSTLKEEPCVCVLSLHLLMKSVDLIKEFLSQTQIRQN